MLKFEIKINNLKFFDKGKRSLVYTGTYNHKKVGIKIKNPSSKAESRIQNEGKFLKKLTKYGIGPNLIIAKRDYIVYEFISGKCYYTELQNLDYPERIRLSLEILDQCRIMDKLKINKLEFNRPIKHFFIIKKQVKMIDFERCYNTKRPKNVTQFCNFLLSKPEMFKLEKNNLIKLLIEYKNNQNKKQYEKIKKLIQTSKY